MSNAAADAYAWGYKYLQDRLRSIGYHGWAKDCDDEIAARIAAFPTLPPAQEGKRERWGAPCVATGGAVDDTFPLAPTPPSEKERTERFFIDHGMIHDRVTGRHVHGDRSIEPGVADEALVMLNEFHYGALREIKRATAGMSSEKERERLDLAGRLEGALTALRQCKPLIPPKDWPRYAEQVLDLAAIPRPAGSAG